MSRARVVVIALVAMLLVALLPAPAAAAGTAHVSARIVFQPPGKAAVDLSPNKDVTVTFWRYNDTTQLYDVIDTGAWTGKLGSAWTSPALEPGAYSVRFVASDTTIGVEYWKDARLWVFSQDVEVIAGKTQSLGTVSLDPWTIEADHLGGADRFATAAEISRATTDIGATPSVVYLANGMDYPDALAAGPAAAARGGVLLLTAPRALPAATRAELVRLKPTEVVIVGGTGAVSDAVRTEVRRAVPAADVRRLGGATRYQTAEAIIRDTFPAGRTQTVFVATGRNYPDALAAGAAAGSYAAPVLLVDGTPAALTAADRALLTWLGAKQAMVIGGTGAVSTGIERELTTRLGSTGVSRYSGASRYDTAADMNMNLFGLSDVAFLSSGLNFPDALAGVPLAAYFSAPLYLTPHTCLIKAAEDGLGVHRPNAVFLLGGPGALSPGVGAGETCR